MTYNLTNSASETGELTVRVWRGAEEGDFAVYRVPARANQTVLDVVTEIQRHQAPDLAYRFACRVGVCGSCAMMVNGVPRWTCRTHVNRVADGGALTVEPLRNLPRIRDLACDMTPFFDKWKAAGGRFEGGATRTDLPAKVDPASPKRKAADAGIECINCAVCYAACDVVAGDAAYLGPAALLRAWTLVNDERHVAGRETREGAMGAGGCGSCHSQGSCMAHCPVGLSPTEGIAGLKRMSLAAMVFGSRVMERRLFLLQRLTAMALAPLVLVHLGLVLVAIRGGLTAAEILARTQGSIGWALFYGLFVVAIAIHAPIGVRNVLRETTGLPHGVVDFLALGFGVLLLTLGLRAVWAVVG